MKEAVRRTLKKELELQTHYLSSVEEKIKELTLDLQEIEGRRQNLLGSIQELKEALSEVE